MRGLLQAIDGLDADVLTIENSRSGDEMLRALAKYGYSRDIGAGVYDVHSPVVPPVDFIEKKIKTFLDVGLLGGNKKLLWVNPDCGLKTREWSQVRNLSPTPVIFCSISRGCNRSAGLIRRVCCGSAQHELACGDSGSATGPRLHCSAAFCNDCISEA